MDGLHVNHIIQHNTGFHFDYPVEILVDLLGGSHILARTNDEISRRSARTLNAQLVQDAHYNPAIYDCATSMLPGSPAMGVLGGDAGNSGVRVRRLWQELVGNGNVAQRDVVRPAVRQRRRHPRVERPQHHEHDLDRHASSAHHDVNATVRLKAWNDWASRANPFVIPADVYVTPANGATNVARGS